MEIIHRDVSWLHFNSRLLQEAANPEVPLMERIRFLGIYSNNLDEFYKVRVASVNRLIEFNRKNYPDKLEKARSLHTQLTTYIEKRQLEFNAIKKQLVVEMEEHGVFVVDEKHLSTEQERFVRRFFKDEVATSLPILELKHSTNLNILVGGSIYLGVILKKSGSQKQDYALVQIPTGRFPRYIILPDRRKGMHSIIRLDDVIRCCLDDIFSVFGYTDFEAYTIKITRDAEIELYGNVSKSYIDIVADSIKKRKIGTPVRFIYDKEMPDTLKQTLITSLKIKRAEDMVSGVRYHNSRDYMDFPNLIGEKYEYKKLVPIPHRHIVEGQTIMSSIARQDILLHFPYNSFDYIINLLREASISPNVRSIKVTLYRLANDSKIISALINAANNGKSVTVFLELKARFEEEHNIYLTKLLEEAGVTIIKTIPGIKVHSKLIHITVKGKERMEYFSVISTGNFNEKTAKLYSDIAFLTADFGIGLDVGKVFYLLESAYRIITFDHLIVSPLYTRTTFISLIDNEIANANAGREAWIDIKVNSLIDSMIIDKLIEAERAGVIIRVCARASCSLLGDDNSNIQTVGIVDKLLEHARIFIFCNNNDNKYYIGSADLMLRNLDLRIEVTTPIYDKRLQRELKDIMNLYFSDNMRARDWRSKERNDIVVNSKKPIRSQFAIYDYLKKLKD